MDRIYLSHLEISQFRNIAHLEIAPTARFNIISGLNGAGKTNLLEAIYYFSALRSFRTVRRQETVRHGESRALIKGLFSGPSAGLICECEIGPDFKRIKRDGKEVTSASWHFSSLPMVIFSPANIALVQGGAEERRRFMDRALFQAEPSYSAVRAEYVRALKNRNKLLKSQEVSRSILAPFDAQLADLGATIVTARTRFIDGAEPLFEEALGEIGKGLEGHLKYRPNISGERAEIHEALDRSFPQDSRRGFTSRGPHADDLEIGIRDLLAKKFASQGQQRMAVLSMKMAETMALHRATGCVPILLLDDISSELDRDRNRALFEFLSRVGGQVFITTTHLDHVLLEDSRRDFYIENGQISELGDGAR
jgi:DNA replication and repair protein RecF